MNENRIKILATLSAHAQLIPLKKRYEPVELVRFQLDAEQPFLAASPAASAMKVDQVTVEDFQNGFDGHEESDWTISFD